MENCCWIFSPCIRFLYDEKRKKNCWYFCILPIPFSALFPPKKDNLFIIRENLFPILVLAVLALTKISPSTTFSFSHSQRTMMNNQLTQIITKPNPIILNGLLHRYFRQSSPWIGEEEKRENQYKWWPRTKQRKSPFIVELVFLPMNEIFWTNEGRKNRFSSRMKERRKRS